MALQSKVGSLTSPTATGNQSYTGVGFKPKAIVFWGFYNPTADGTLALITPFMGIVSDTTHRGAVNWAVNDGVGPVTNYIRGHANDAPIYATGTSGVIRLQSDLVSLDADGFTLSWTTVQATGYIVNYFCLGGTDLTNTIVLQNTTKTSTGSQAYTGAGFKPDALITICAGHNTIPDSTVQNNAHPFLSFSTATGQKAIAFSTEDNGVNFLPQTLQKTDVLAMINGSGTQTIDATLTSLDTDGFTLNYGAADITARYFWTLCLKGGQYKVGTINQKTSTGVQGITGIGFQPTGIFLASQGQTTSTSIQNAGTFILGAASSSSSRGVISTDTRYNVALTNESENLDRSNVYKDLSANDASPTINATADLSSFDPDGFTLNYSVADATAREIMYLIFGSNRGRLTNYGNYVTVGQGMSRSEVAS